MSERSDRRRSEQIATSSAASASRRRLTRSWALAGLARGSFASALWNTSSTAVGSVGSRDVARGTSAFRCANASVVGVSPANGRRPVRSSNATTPSAYRVARGGRRFSAGLLGREVPGRPEHGSRLRERVRPRGRSDTEVGDLHVFASSSRRRFAGLTSRCTTPFACAPVDRDRSLLEPGECPTRRPPGAQALETEPPSRYSMTMSGRPRCSATSKTLTTFGAAESRAARAPLVESALGRPAGSRSGRTAA